MDITRPSPTPEELRAEASLRPKNLSEFIGQERIVKNLLVFIRAAKMEGRALEHILLFGPPGLGKTTLAHLVAAEMGVNIHVTAGPALKKPLDLAGILTSLSPGEVLFIDEIHRLSPQIEEFLYPAMEDFRVDITLGNGPGTRVVNLSLSPFTLIGATTRQGLLTGPLRSRFGMAFRLDFYTPQELGKIVLLSAQKLGVEITPDAAMEIGRRSRGTPRIANRLLRRARDFATVRGEGVLTLEVVREALEALGVDELGLDELDKRLLRVIIENYRGGPVGIKTLSMALGEDPGTLEEVYEPYLVQEGLLARTPRGRVATPKAYRHLGYM